MYETLKKLNGYHPTAQVVYEEVSKNHPHISKGTVYRNLGILSELGKILRISMGDGVDRYDDNISFHGHLICKDCKQLFDVKLGELVDVSEMTVAGFIVDSQAIIMHGTCPSCAKKKQN